MNPPLAAIPQVDLRSGGPVAHARAARERALALRNECVSWLPRVATAALPGIDALTRKWLARSCSPYVGEIEAIAAELGQSGIWFLNGCYEWGCTSLAREQDGGPWLARTLDWPLPGLGRHLEVARMCGPGGEFESVGWPGYVGVLTASAPGRFAAAINQAPLWRRTDHPWLRPYDIVCNALRTWGVRFMPPDHLLRNVFEHCRSFGEAKVRLETTPIARPAIYTLVGCERGETCVIERTEASHSTRMGDTAAANDWHVFRPQWEARTRADLMFTRSSQETAQGSRDRCQQLLAWSGPIDDGGFGWVTPPILNPYTRLAVAMCPAIGVLHASGFEVAASAELPRAVSRTAQTGISAHEVVHCAKS